MTAGTSPEEWVGRPVAVVLIREPESESTPRNPRNPRAGLPVRGWLEGVSEYGLMLRQPRTGEDEQLENIVFYPWAQVRFVRQTDPETIPS